MALYSEYFILAFLFFITAVYGGDVCFDFIRGQSRYCTYGCCGSLNQDCCSANVALIVGLTVMAVLIVSVVIAVVCCVRRRRAAPGSIISTQPGATGFVVQTNQSAMNTVGQPVGAYQYGAGVPMAQGMYAPPAYPPGPSPYPYGAPGSTQPYGMAAAPPPYNTVAGQDNTGFKQ